MFKYIKVKTKGQNEGGNLLVPKLRFNEFKDEWKAISLKKAFTFFSTNSLSRADLTPDGLIKNIHYGDIHQKFNNILDVEKEKLPYINPNIELTIKNNLCQSGDLIFADASEDYEGIGKAIEIINVGNNKVVSGLHTIHVRDIESTMSIGFKGYLFNTPIIHNQIRILANGFKVFGISKNDICKLNVRIPSKIEQEKISKFLILLDKKIELQKRKVDALKIYKKWLSKKLFSFNSIYEKKLGDLCSITTGKLDANAMSENGKYRFFTCAKEYYYINTYAFDTEALLISGNGAYVGYINYYKGKFNAYQRTYVLDKFNEDIFYIKYFLDEFLPLRIFSEKKDGNTPYIVLSTLSNMTIKFPDFNTQKIIVNILSKLDKKINLSEERLKLLSRFKNFLLQQMFI